MILNRLHTNKSGQILTSVIVFMAFGISVVALSAALTIINIKDTLKNSESTTALNYAEAGVEEAYLRIIRDPAYAGGSLLVNDTQVQIAVTGDDVNKIALSTAEYNGFTRKVQIELVLADGRVNLVSWKQVL